MLKKRIILSNALLITIIAAALVALSRLDAGGVPFFYSLDAPFQDRLVRLRNLISDPPVSQEIALIGQNDSSARFIGKFGSGTWRVRQPFSEQIPVLRHVYQPRVLAYDIIFKPDAGESFRTADMLIYDHDKLGLIRKHVDDLVESGDVEMETDVLLSLNQLSSEQGNIRFSTELSNFMAMEAEDRTQPILAYYFPEDTRRTWDRQDILGDDPSWESEENGLTVPYLRDVSIPLRHVHNLDSDFAFYEYRVDMPSPIFLDVAQLGYINVGRDPDGIPRWYPMLRGLTYTFTDPETGEERTRRLILPSIALLSVLHYWGIDPAAMNSDDNWETEDGQPRVEVHMGDEIIIRHSAGQVATIPIDERGRMFLDYRRKTTDFTGVNFNLLTEGGAAAQYDPETNTYLRDPEIFNALHGKIVFVGVMETGSTDVRPTPLEAQTGLVAVHMTAASNILDGTHIAPMKNGSMIIVLLLYFLIVPASVYMTPLRFAILQGGTAVLYAGILYAGIHLSTFMLPILAPAILLLLTYFAVVFYYYITEEREKRKIRGMFATMVSGEVLRFLEEHPESFSLAGQQAQATIFFSDVAGFTTISENLPPDRLVALLNAYLTPMTEIIHASQGSLDKYLGDAIMAEWGVPYPNADHARLACYAALDQLAELARLRPELKKEFGVELYVRMGINSGLVSAGGMGSTNHMSYTVMGDAVNQAARFEPANKDYDTEIMIGESTYELARDFIEARLLDRIIVKGKTVPIHIYELIAKSGELSPEKAQIVQHYEVGLRAHWERDWDAAIAAFDAALAIDPGDGPSIALRARVLDYQESPPHDAWQGEYIRRTKD